MIRSLTPLATRGRDRCFRGIPEIKRRLTAHSLRFLRAALATDRRLRGLADPLITRALPLARGLGDLPASRLAFRRHQ